MIDIFSVFKAGFSNNKKEQSEVQKSSSYVFFISCFLDNLWTHNINLYLNDNELKVDNLFEKTYVFENKKYRVVIHRINISNIKKLNLFIFSDRLSWNLNEIPLQEKKVIFDNLEINPRNYVNIQKHFLHENDNTTKIYYNLKDIEKLNIFIDFFMKVYLQFIKNNNNNFDKIVLDNLFEKFIEITQNQKEFDFCFLIKIFIISLGTGKINNFINIFEKLNIQLIDKSEINIFNYFLDIYNNNKNIQNEKWSKSLDKMNTIYQLLYEDPSKIEKQKLIEVKPILIKLINNKKEINKKLEFIIYKYKSIYTLFSVGEKELFDVSFESIPYSFDFNNFYQTIYLPLLKEEEQYGIFLNLSKLSDYYFKQFLKNEKIVSFSFILDIFNLIFGTEKIIFFLDNFYVLNYNLDSEINNKKFNRILNLYKNHKKEFLEKHQPFFEENKKKK